MCVSFDHFIPVLLAFVVFGLVTVLQYRAIEIGWDECLRNQTTYSVPREMQNLNKNNNLSH